jgi:hypothetical protein
MSGTDTIERGVIAGAYLGLAGNDGEFVSLRLLRDALGGAARNLDETLVGMYAEGMINLVPAENQMALTPADRAAGIRCGGEVKHRMSWEG